MALPGRNSCVLSYSVRCSVVASVAHPMVSAVEDSIRPAARAIHIVAVAAEGALEVAAFAHVQGKHVAQAAGLAVLAGKLHRPTRHHELESADVALHQLRVFTL